jgi:hypothetical protein
MSEQLEVPTPLTLSYKGKSYVLTPLGARDMVEHANYLRDLYLDQTKKDLKGLPIDAAIQVFKDAKAFADKIKPVTDEYTEQAQTFAGLTYQFYLSVRKKHPDVSLELAADILESNFGEIAAKANQMAGFKAAGDDTPLAQTGAA